LSAFIGADGSILSSTHAALTITRTGPGVYNLNIPAGTLGTSCVMLALTPIATSAIMSFAGGSCGGGGITTTVYTTPAQDTFWSLLAIGGGPVSGLAASGSDEIALPKAGN
jgi:hypothetical protein